MHPTWLCITLVVSGTKVATPFRNIFIFCMFIEKYRKYFVVLYVYPLLFLFEEKFFLLLLLFAINMYESLFIYMPSEATITSHQFARPILWLVPRATNMSNFRHWATDSLRDKLQTLPIFMFILYQMDKPSGICIMSPNTKALALHSHVVLALNSFILFIFILKLNVYVWFWIFGCIYLFMNAWV
jgi:hypothetical protein